MHKYNKRFKFKRQVVIYLVSVTRKNCYAGLVPLGAWSNLCSPNNVLTIKSQPNSWVKWSTSESQKRFLLHHFVGVHYKAFLVTVRTSAEKLVEEALRRANITDNPHHYCIWQVASASNGKTFGCSITHRCIPPHMILFPLQK